MTGQNKSGIILDLKIWYYGCFLMIMQTKQYIKYFTMPNCFNINNNNNHSNTSRLIQGKKNYLLNFLIISTQSNNQEASFNKDRN